MAKKKTPAKKNVTSSTACPPKQQKLWCLTGMAAAIIVLTWLDHTWARIVITVLAALMLVRSLVFNCKKP